MFTVYRSMRTASIIPTSASTLPRFLVRPKLAIRA
jgi:hypothetical protein